MNRRIKIAACIPNLADATAYYRAVAPLSHLQQYYDYDITLLEQVNSLVAHFYDLAFFQRPTAAPHVAAMTQFKKLGVPVIVDYDDDLLRVPEDNTAYFVYADPNLRQNYLNAVQIADHVIVSTEQIKQGLLAIFPDKKVSVVKNAIDERVCHTQQATPGERIVWRGTNTHVHDLFQMKDTLNQHQITYFGYNPWFVDQSQKQIKAPVLEVIDYLYSLYSLAPRIGIVPLVDSQFNRGKSNIALLELVWAGAACLVPDWDEWKIPGTAGYSTPEEFKDSLSTLSSMPKDQLDDMRKQAWFHIQNHYRLSHTNLERDLVFRSAISDQFKRLTKTV